MRLGIHSSLHARFGEFQLDVRTGELRRNGDKLSLQEKPFQVLIALLERPGQLITRDELKTRLWPSNTFVDFDQSLNKAVNRLREVLEDSAEEHRFIETLPRRGYRFVAPLETPNESGLSFGVTQGQPSGSHVSRTSRDWIFLAGIILTVSCSLGAWWWVRHHDRTALQTNFQRLSFGRGAIRSARFSADGRTVIYGASWDGKPYQIFVGQAGNVESRPLGVEADILAVSRTGEMAVLLKPQFGVINVEGTLALLPSTGTTPRRLLDRVQDADWSPDGSQLAVTHYVGTGRCALEFPPGKELYETTGGVWLSHARVSPRGTQIAFLEHPVQDDDAGFVSVIDLAGKKRALTHAFGGVEGLAWDPAGNEIWFSARDPNSRAPLAIFTVTTAGQQRLVRREAGPITVLDVARDGHVLFTRDTVRAEAFGRIFPDHQERDLGWLHNSTAEAISADGANVLLSAQGEASSEGYEAYVRSTDGSPALRLGEGVPRAFSPDGKWALVSSTGGIRSALPPQLLLVPIGPGQPKTLSSDGIIEHFSTFFLDGKSMLVEGNEPERAPRSWVTDSNGSKLRPITPEGTVGHQISKDGKWLAAVDPQRRFWVYPVAGGAPSRLSGVEPGEEPITWSGDGHSLFVANMGVVPVRVYRLDIHTGRREFLYELSPGDRAGLWSIRPVLITPDGKSYVYSYYQVLSDLYMTTDLQ